MRFSISRYWMSLILLLLCAFPGFSEGNSSSESSHETHLDRALFQTTASNIVVWFYDYAVLQASWARISPETWQENLQHGFVWDGAWFFTNQILHPYHGSIYFNAARLNGFTFWDSFPFTVYGSLMWELFMERDYPSMNDFITTPLAGTAMGEVTYRLSLSFLNSDATGYKRVAREIAAAILNPVLFINRIVYGEEVLRRNPSPKEEFTLTIYSGINRTGDAYPLFLRTPHPFLGFLLNYGDPTDERERYLPFDAFRIFSAWDLDYTNPGWEIFASGILYGRKIFLPNGGRGVLGIYQHFDYLQNFVYKFASNGIGFGTEMRPMKQIELFEFQFHLYGILLGALDSRYTMDTQGGEYIWGSGAAAKLGVHFVYDEFSSSVFYYKYWFYTVKGADSHNTVGIFSFSVEHVLRKDVRIGAELHIYDRWSNVDVNNSSRMGARTYLAHTL
ncbi:MAG: DUF3943 domain-containing protein [Spirochaetes bacterium]|nr:DUF3943 domain-containing protein [Spirochaetota bacterium]